MQSDPLFLRDLSGRGIYQLAVGDPISKPTATELVTTPSGATCGRPSGASLRPSRSSSGGQTDNGAGFRSVFEEFLQERGMAMPVIQPRRVKQNGCVEWCQRTRRKELYETSSAAT